MTRAEAEKQYRKGVNTLKNAVPRKPVTFADLEAKREEQIAFYVRWAEVHSRNGKPKQAEQYLANAEKLRGNLETLTDTELLRFFGYTGYHFIVRG